MRLSIYRKAHFNAAHRLHINSWSDKKNKDFFGPCNNKNYHGHNYEMEVKLTGEVDPISGYLFDINKLKHIIESEIHDYLDHKNLNLDVPEFKTLNPTAENIAFVIWNRLRKVIASKFEIGVRLYETPRNFVDYNGQ